MTGRDSVDLERSDLLGRSFGQDDVLVRRRRRVTAEHAPGLHGRAEAAQELEPVLTQLSARPVGGRQQALDVVGFLGAQVQREQELVRVAEHARAAELLEQLDALARLWPSLGDVSERNDQLGAATLQIRERSSEGDGVSVHVGEEGDAHTGTL